MKKVLLALAGLWIAMEIAAAIAGAPFEHWNDIRLARALAFRMGVPIYLGKDALGPILGTLHLPLSHLMYQPALLFMTPGAAIAAGSALSVVFVAGPMAWLLLGVGRRCWLAYLALLSVCLQSFSIAFPMTSIHADATAIGLALLAAGLIYRGRGWVLAGALAALCVAAKQTMAPIPIALFLWVALMERRVTLVRFALGLAGGTIVGVGAALAIAGSLDALVFNVITLAGHRPAKDNWAEMVGAGLRWLRWEGLTAVVCLAVALVGWWRRSDRVSALAQNRWLIFGAAAAAQSPVLLKAWLTMGGDVNHLGGLLVLLWTGSILALRDMEDARLAKVILAVLLVVNLSPAAPSSLAARCRQWGSGESDQAFRYLKESHPHTWFPWHPLAHAMAEGRFYHVDFPLKDRELAGHPVTQAQFQAGLPDQLEQVLLPAGAQTDSQALTRFLAGFEKVDQPALATWVVFRRR